MILDYYIESGSILIFFQAILSALDSAIGADGLLIDVFGDEYITIMRDAYVDSLVFFNRTLPVYSSVKLISISFLLITFFLLMIV